MPDKPPEREIWIEPGQDRATRYWQPIVFQGGVRYILASQVAPPAERWIECAKCGNKRLMADDTNFLCRYCFSTEVGSPPADAVERAREPQED